MNGQTIFAPNVVMHPVESSWVQAIGYSASLQRLFVETRLGALYSYWPTSIGTFFRLRMAPSKGAFINQYLKGVGYLESRVRG